MSKPLSREDKIKLLELAQERAKRDLVRKPPYHPNQGQMEVHKSKALSRWVLSGNGAGKTTLLVNELRWMLEGKHPITGEIYPIGMKIICVVDNTRKIGDLLIPEWRKWADLPEEWTKREGKPHVSRITNPANNNSISFYSIESDPMLFEGVSVHAACADEPIPRHLYVALRRSLRIKGYPGKWLFCGTPISEPWIRTEIYDRWTKNELPDTEIFRVSTEVNRKNLAAEYIENFSRALSENEKRVRLEGSFFDGDAMALAHLWNRDAHIIKAIDWHPEWPVVISIDPHPVKKHVAIMLGADKDNRIYALKELAVKQTAREFAQTLKGWYAGYRVADIVVDSLGNTEGTGNEGFLTFLEVLRQEGVPARVTRFEEKSHEDLIDRLQTSLLIPEGLDNYGMRIPKLRVLQGCKGLISDIESVTWVKNRSTGEYLPKLDTGSKDYLSALGYALAAGVRIDRGSEKPIYLKKAPYGLSLRSQRQMAVNINNFRKRYGLK
jgi:hypothetical protein